MATLHRTLVAPFALLAMVPTVFGQACPARHQFKFSDGGQACISDYAFAEEAAVGWPISVQRLIPVSGIYSITSSPRDGTCPAVVGMVISRKNTNTPLIAQVRDEPREREEAARKDCQKKVDLSKAADTSCPCKLVIEDGVSPMTQRDFDSFMATAAAVRKP